MEREIGISTRAVSFVVLEPIAVAFKCVAYRERQSCRVAVDTKPGTLRKLVVADRLGADRDADIPAFEVVATLFEPIGKFAILIMNDESVLIHTVSRGL